MEPSLTPLSQAETASVQQKLLLENQIKNGVNWFFWIAGLSLINSVIYSAGGTLSFVVGLAATQFVDGIMTAIANEIGGGIIVRGIGLVVNAGIAGIFAGAGVLGRKKHRWAVIVGMVLYVLDGLVFLAFGDFLPAAFHAFALFGLWRGQKAIGDLKALESNAPVTSTSAFQ